MSTKANKTQPTNRSLDEFYNKIDDELKREDAKKLAQLITDVTGEKPVLWGTSIVGFGMRHYTYDSGREGDTMKVGFAVRKKALTIYGLLMHDQGEESVALAQHLGPHDHGKGCLYINSLDEIDVPTLKKMIAYAYTSK